MAVITHPRPNQAWDPGITWDIPVSGPATPGLGDVQDAARDAIQAEPDRGPAVIAGLILAAVVGLIWWFADDPPRPRKKRRKR